MHTATTRAADDLLRDGYARISLHDDGKHLLDRVLGESRSFFGRPVREKARYASTDLNFGYRPQGREFAISADRPDLNDCFTLWHDRLELIPNSAEIPALTGALLAWRECLSAIVSDTVGEVAAQLGGHKAPPFEAASYLQLNNYAVADSDRDLLQDKHEDGHLVTVIHTTAPGLELWLDGEARPMQTAADEVILMPGSVFTDLSGGRVPALYHQVRNLRLADRTALMYFVNPELTEPVYSWAAEPGQTPVDLRDKIRSNPAMFGLPDVPTL
ncbi:2-oxoglutarate and iron-dependent oxygenase domain-containing protein [Kitasatospora kifunensis]|uniref:Isopenicillin N synthase-like dioxygenase n=1 Tax=Kitasatospora kifunensis TaxID=58351 RepID=A0A7W7VZY6_KITKI|nr:2-oxoglutarate and iron-dependent oxygenase domain-containing protein [Kitasatospora kifunensis]MBB4928095.1 isopenicillin N synthase-like dioxygenase [Kitasatospora kifunensis]